MEKQEPELQVGIGPAWGLDWHILTVKLAKQPEHREGEKRVNVPLQSRA